MESRCTYCNSPAPAESLTEFEDHRLCPSCLEEHTVICDRCGDRIWEEDAESDVHRYLCQDCYNRHYVRCDNCDRLLHENDAYYVEDDDKPFCYACYCNRTSSIHEYNYKPEPYLCFTNTHDGSGAIRVCMTLIRIVCNNTLNLALDNARRAWSVRHTGDWEFKMHEARHCLQMANAYMGELAVEADRLAHTSITNDQIKQILNELFPLDEHSTDREKQNVKKLKDEFMVCYFSPDILKFQNSKWGVVNAMSDMVTHNAPIRKTRNYRENNWGRLMDGHVMMDKMTALLNTI